MLFLAFKSDDLWDRLSKTSMLGYPSVYLYRNYFSPVLLLLTSYNPHAPKSVRQCVGYYNGFIGTLVSEAGASDWDDILSMPEMRASGTGVLNVH